MTEEMWASVAVAAPVFALILCGYGAGRARLFPAEGLAGLNTFVFYFALPALLFAKLAVSPLAGTLDPRFVVGYVGTALAVFALAALSSRWLFGSRLGEMGVQGLGAVWGNTGYLGIPLAIAAFGDAGAVPMVVGLFFDVTLMLSLTVLMLELNRDPSAGWRRVAHRLAPSLARNPIIIASVAGVAVALVGGAEGGYRFPEPVSAFLGLLGEAAGPCALFSLGATLAAGRIASGAPEVAHLTLCKLVLHPLAIWLAMGALGVTPLWAKVAILNAALPIATNVYIVAAAYHTAVARTSTAVLLSTLLSLVTIPLVLGLLLAAEPAGIGAGG